MAKSDLQEERTFDEQLEVGEKAGKMQHMEYYPLRVRNADTK